MLHIKTSKDNLSKKLINDIEAWFNADVPAIESMYLDNESVKILQNIEGMTERKGTWIEAKFGAVPLMSISTGAKIVLLCNTLYEKHSFNIDEAGYNAIREILRISQNKDVEVYSGRVLEYFPENYEAIVEDELCVGKDITYSMAFLLDEEV